MTVKFESIYRIMARELAAMLKHQREAREAADAESRERCARSTAICRAAKR